MPGKDEWAAGNFAADSSSRGVSKTGLDRGREMLTDAETFKLAAFIVDAIRQHGHDNKVGMNYVDASGGLERAVIDGIFDIKAVAAAILKEIKP